jgi:hypothetical protein
MGYLNSIGDKKKLEGFFRGIGKWCVWTQFLFDFQHFSAYANNTRSYNPQVLECHAINTSGMLHH